MLLIFYSVVGYDAIFINLEEKITKAS